MAKLHISLIWPGCADGKYAVKAKGCILAVLRWGDASGPFPNWSPLGYAPVDPAGNGGFAFSGRRAIPSGATHVWAMCVGHDFQTREDVSAEIPARFLPPKNDGADAARFSILTDLHLAAKPWNIRRALRATESDHVLLLGDSTNDGLPAQFEQFEACIADEAPEKIILPVIGNHDVAHPRMAAGDGCQSYAGFQARRLAVAERGGMAFARDPNSLAWAARMGAVDVVGLQCVISGRKFLFPEGRQVEWLEDRLSAQRDAAWHLILCHAPLLKHNPNRSDGQPYLDRNQRIQALVDQTGRCVFLSGHTHVSPNATKGAAEWDAARGNLYLNCGSVVDTSIEGEAGLMAPDWKDGCATELALSRDSVEIVTRSVRTGAMFPRGCYRFAITD